MRRPTLIVINGLPASGKSTLATPLAEALAIPIFSKDDFKELLADKTGLLDQENTRKLGRASYSILFLIAQRCLERGGSLIIEGNFTLGTETLEFVSYLKTQKFAVVEILCHAPGQVLFDRFMKRKRHPVHHALDDKAHAECAETLRVGKIPSLAVDRLLEVDTTGPVELQPILDFIRAE